MHMNFQVTYTDGRVLEGTAAGWEFVQFERKYDVGVAEFSKSPRIEWMYYLAFLAMQKLHQDGNHDGPIKASFDAWLQAVESVENVDGDAPLGEPAS